MEPELCQRMDPSDVIQETLATASNRIEDYLERRPATFRLWLRRNALERLVDARRRHTAHKRDVKRDVRLSDASSMAIVHGLLSGRVTEAVLRQELMRQVREAITALSDTDREILEMRHTEELTNLEVAELLQVDPDTLAKRRAAMESRDAYQPLEPRRRRVSQALRAYAAFASSADKGGVRDLSRVEGA